MANLEVITLSIDISTLSSESFTTTSLITQQTISANVAIAGPAGAGVPTGGTSAQVLAKNSSTNFDTHWVSAGAGTVTSASVVSANGLAGTVATSTTTPAITLSTSVTGVLRGNGTAISAATAGTDYVIPSGSITGNAATATKLATARNINGVAFDGTAAITVADATKLAISNNLSDLGSATTARTNLGLGSLATLSSVNLVSNVGTSILPVANGGTGINDAAVFSVDSNTPLNGVTRIRQSFVNFLANAAFGTWSLGGSAAPDGWTPNGGVTVAQSSTTTIGSFSAQLTFDTSNTGEFYQDIGISTLVDYTFSCYVQRTSGTGTARLVAQEEGSPFAEYVTANLPTATGWQLVALTARPSAGTLMRFSIKSGGTTASTWLISECMAQEGLGVASAFNYAAIDDTTSQYIHGSKTFTAPLTLSSALVVSSGGTGAATLTGLVKGNGTSAFTAAAAGTDYAGISTTQTLTSSFIQPRVSTLTASSNTYTPNCDTTDLALISSPTANFTVANPTGTPQDGQKLLLRIASGSTGYTPSWGTSYASSGIATLPTPTLPASKTVTLGFVYDAAKSKLYCLALDGTGY